MTRTEARCVAHLLDQVRACPTQDHAYDKLDEAEPFLLALPPVERDRVYCDAHAIIETLPGED